jgi:hypothetical protein
LKDLDGVSCIRDKQLRLEPERRGMKAPRQRDQHNPRLFKNG